MPPTPPGFSKNVFINCPFDHEYESLLRPILFTIVYLGFNPQIASQRADSGEQRINKIVSLISKSKYSIHDLSRARSEHPREYYRLNMPFELGIDYGSRRTAGAAFSRKRFLVLGSKPHDYKRALSDLAGVDAESHGNKPERAISAVRNWFVSTVRLRSAASPTVIWYKFNDFTADFYAKRKDEGFSKEDLKMMPVREYIAFIRKWVKDNK
jgi:hypothetical protein